jgi:hypothetical protein
VPPSEQAEIRFPNPDGIDVHFAQMERGGQIGDLWEAARAANVQPRTIMQWVRRRKIEPLLTGQDDMVFHLPTVEQASTVGPGRPKKNAA